MGAIERPGLPTKSYDALMKAVTNIFVIFLMIDEELRVQWPKKGPEA